MPMTRRAPRSCSMTRREAGRTVCASACGSPSILDPEYTSFGQAIQRYWEAIGVKAVLEGASVRRCSSASMPISISTADLADYTTSGDPALGISRVYTTNRSTRARPSTTRAAIRTLKSTSSSRRDATPRARAERARKLLQGAGDPRARPARRSRSIDEPRSTRRAPSSKGLWHGANYMSVERRMARAIDLGADDAPPDPR